MKIKIDKARQKDAEEILLLQRFVFKEGFEIYNYSQNPPFEQTLQALKDEFNRKTFFKATCNGRLVGCIRSYREVDTCFPEKLFIHPDFQNRGIAQTMMKTVENYYTGRVTKFRISTDKNNKKNLYLYKKMGYKPFKTKTIHHDEGFVYMEKAA